MKCSIIGRSSLSDIMETNPCMVPNNSLELKAQALKLLYGRYISQIFKEMKHGINDNLLSQRTLVTKISETASCPFKKNGNMGVFYERISPEDMYTNSANYRSTCPTHIEADFDANRSPKVINIVKCACHQCIQSTGRTCRKDGSHCLQFTGTCSPILHPLPVVRRKCKADSPFYEYHAVFEYVPVGCTCKI